MTRLDRRVLARRAMLVRRVAAVLRAEFADLSVEERTDAVILVGRGLVRRSLGDARLRGLVALVREGRR